MDKRSGDCSACRYGIELSIECDEAHLVLCDCPESENYQKVTSSECSCDEFDCKHCTEDSPKEEGQE